MNDTLNKDINKLTLQVFMQTVGSSMVMVYMNLFMTDYLMIAAATVSTALVIAKTIDLVFSVVAGPIMEKVRFKNGKYRPWLNIVKWLLFISFTLTYLNTYELGVGSEWLRAGVIIVSYVGFGAGMSLLMICRGGVLQYMAGADMGIRAKISARQAQATAAATIITSACVLPLIKLVGGFTGDKWAYWVTCTFLALFMLFGAGGMARLARNYDAPSDAAAKKTVTVKDMFNAVAGNSQLLIMILSMGIFYISMNVLTGIQVYYFRYIINDYGFMATSMTIKTAFAFVASLFIPRLGKKLGKRMSYVVGLLGYAASMVFIGVFGGSSKWIFTIGTCLFTAFMYMFSSFGVNYFLDCGEYGYHKTGKDYRSTAMAMFNLPMKIGFVGGSAIAGYGLAAIGYQPGMEITADFTSKYMLIIGTIPAVLCVLAAVIFLVGYKIKDEDAARYAKENAERDAAMTVAQAN